MVRPLLLVIIRTTYAGWDRGETGLLHERLFILRLLRGMLPLLSVPAMHTTGQVGRTRLTLLVTHDVNRFVQSYSMVLSGFHN
jgi:thioester reductase-like protein